jgi:hypothetical protein
VLAGQLGERPDEAGEVGGLHVQRCGGVLAAGARALAVGGLAGPGRCEVDA